jgi:hypothetical protein
VLQSADGRRSAANPVTTDPCRHMYEAILRSSSSSDKVSHNAGQRPTECLPREVAQHVLPGRLSHLLRSRRILHADVR